MPSGVARRAPGRAAKAEPGADAGSAALMPHLLAADPATADPFLRDRPNTAAWYLLMRGDTGLGHDLADRLYRQWRSQLGGDDPATLRAATSVAAALSYRGRYAAARDLDQDTLDRRRLRGEDHPDTLASANNLAVDLRAMGEPDGS